MQTNAYFKIHAEQHALKTIGNIIAMEVVRVMALGTPWVTSQRWGTLDVYASIYKDTTVRVEHNGTPVFIYKNGTTFMRAGIWTDEIRKHCLHMTYNLTYQISLAKQQKTMLTTTESLQKFSRETNPKEK